MLIIVVLFMFSVPLMTCPAGGMRASAPLTAPVLAWSAFLGGNGSDSGYAIAMDDSGNMVVAGRSYATWGSPIRAYTPSGWDAFVAKVDGSGNLVWNTFLGGSGEDWTLAIAVDKNGNVIVAGKSNLTWGEPVLSYTGGDDAFVAKLDSNGGLVWNTFLGEWGNERAFGVAVDGSGNVVVTGDCSAAWGPPPVRAYSSGWDAYVAKLDSDGDLVWNTFLGASSSDDGNAVAVDGSGNVFVTGMSYYTWGEPVRPLSAGGDAYVAKLDGSGNLVWNTFLGADFLYDQGNGITVDKSGNVYVTGESETAWETPIYDLPGDDDAFVAKLDSSGNLTWNSLLGGTEFDSGSAIAVDGNGNVFVAGNSDASWGAPIRSYTDASDAFVAGLDSSGALTWNTFLGGGLWDEGNGIALDEGGSAVVAGESDTAWGTPVRPFSGYGDAFVAKLLVELPEKVYLPLVVRD